MVIKYVGFYYKTYISKNISILSLFFFSLCNLSRTQKAHAETTGADAIKQLCPQTLTQTPLEFLYMKLVQTRKGDETRKIDFTRKLPTQGLNV